MASQKAKEELARQSGFEDLSFATRSYRPEYASSPDLRGSYRHGRVIRTSEIESTLLAKLAFTSGGRDRKGRSILTIPAGKTEDLSVDRLGDTLSYLTQSPRDSRQSQLYTVIIDLRGSSWKSAKPLLRTLQETVPDKVHEVYIIKPDAFWEKRRSGTGLRKEQSSVVFETTLLSSSSKLHQFVEESQLTQELGGTLSYDHNRWINTRLEIERISDEAISLDDKFDELEQDLDTHQLGNNVSDTDNLIREHESKRAVLDNGHPLIQRGEHLISVIKANEPPVPPSQNFPGSPASMPSQERQQIEGIVTHLKLRCSQLMDMWEKRWKELMQCMDLREFEAGYQKVIDWVLGPGESYLSTSNDIGDSVITCEVLRKEHEEFELSAREVINHFAQVRELAKKMLQENHYASKDIKTQKEFLDRGCRSFAMRMNRRRDVILTSLKFHKSAGECSVNLDDLFELLCSDSVLMYDYETAETMLRTLEDKAEAVAISSEDTLRDALAAQELMTSPVANTRGDDVTPDYSKGIAHVRLTLDELRERKLRTDELCDVRRIKLQQLLQLKQSERDAEQATTWISQLRDATEHNLGDVGRNAEDVEALQHEHEKLEATARSTYDYGRQFLQASLVLRRTCRYELSPNYKMEEKLNNAWGDFSSAMAERGARLSVALMFHRSAEKLVQEIEELRAAYMREDLPEDLTAELVEQEIRRHSDTRHTIDKEYAETVAMGKALIDRMQLPPLYREDGTPNRPPHLLEESLADLEERKMAWERVWQDRDNKLRHWLKLGDYEEQMRELLQWVKDKTNETEENKHVIGQNLAEAEALSSELQELEARLKRC